VPYRERVTIDLPPSPANSPESVESLARTLRRLEDAHRRYRVHAARVVGIGVTELSALTTVSDAPGMTPGDLGRDLVLTSGAVTAVVDRLERADLVYRAADPEDRRVRRLHLTDKGTATMENLDEAYRYVLSTTGSDDAITRALPQLDSITEALDQAGSDGGLLGR